MQDASSRTARLLAALKGQRRQSRAVRAAVVSLQQLKLDALYVPHAPVARSNPGGFHWLTCRDQGRRLWACFARGRPLALERTTNRRLLDMPAYRQWDRHSCGFLAALTVAHTFNPNAGPAAVLAAVRPTLLGGSSQRRLVRGLRRFGIVARCYDRLDLLDLFRLARQGRPIIITVRSGVLGLDHWAIVRGVDRARRRIYLVNHSVWTDRGGLAWNDFQAIWGPHGVGLVCVPVGGATPTIPSFRG